MPYNEKMLNRQIGRNAQLFAQAVSTLETPEARYPYLRILVSVIEQVRSEWVLVPQKAQLFTHLINEMTETPVDADEIKRVLDVRDAERAFLQKAAAGKVPAKPAKASSPDTRASSDRVADASKAADRDETSEANDGVEAREQVAAESPTSTPETADAASEADASEAEGAAETSASEAPAERA